MSGAKKKLERRALQDQMGMTEKQKQELKTKQAKRRNTILAAVGGAIAVVLVIVLLVWNSGIIPRHTTALTVKDHDFSVVDMDYYYYQALYNYSSNEQYMAQLYAQNGLEYQSTFDASVDMKTQYVDADKTQTYYDYFKEQAKENVTQICALYDAAKAAGHTLSEDAQKSLDSALSDLDSQVQQNRFGSRSAYLRALYGRNITEGIYMKNLEMNVLASDYYNATIGAMGDYSDAELQAYYDANADKMDSYDYDYAYFSGTVSSTDADGNAVDGTDEEKAAAMADAQKKAEDLLAAVKAAKAQTPAEGQAAATFLSVAEQQGASATPRTGVMGVNVTSSVYADWLMDAARKDGDVEKFQLEDAGWYVVEFHARYLDNDPTVDARHILLSTAMEDDPATEDVDESQLAPTEERIAQVKTQAEDLLAQFNAGAKTAEAFGELAEEHSADGRDSDGKLSAAGGLYSGIAKGDMVKPFEDWCFDPSRQVGDTGLVQTDFGWHVMYFQALNRPVWMDRASQTKQTEEQNSFMEKAQEGYEAVEGSGWSQVGNR